MGARSGVSGVSGVGVLTLVVQMTHVPPERSGAKEGEACLRQVFRRHELVGVLGSRKEGKSWYRKSV